MVDNYYTTRQFLINQWQEKYVRPNKLNKPKLSSEEKKLLEQLKTFLPTTAKILMITKKAKKICTEKNLPFHRMMRSMKSNSSVFVFPEKALREAVGE
ncbi:hypothetical protein [Thiothrix unzii]|jgi:hypothetical protein|uniref:hypothetical protein n=1 Tax=Thiothrix unzii TaxID=111769 RepID=UPI002A36EDA2|nr:hypothetical protein [Thiothrix unzii]MDX9990247.1 hypothetical protein [Thiothrix unzii]